MAFNMAFFVIFIKDLIDLLSRLLTELEAKDGCLRQDVEGDDSEIRAVDDNPAKHIDNNKPRTSSLKNKPKRKKGVGTSKRSYTVQTKLEPPIETMFKKHTGKQCTVPNIKALLRKNNIELHGKTKRADLLRLLDDKKSTIEDWNS